MKAPCHIRFTPPSSDTGVLPPATTVARSLVHRAPPCFSRTYLCSDHTHPCNGRVAPCCHRLAFVSTPPNILFVDISNFFAWKFHSGTLRPLIRLSVTGRTWMTSSRIDSATPSSRMTDLGQKDVELGIYLFHRWLGNFQLRNRQLDQQVRAFSCRPA